MAYFAASSSSSSSQTFSCFLHGNVGPAASGEHPLQILELRFPMGNAVFPLSLRQFFQHSPPFFFHFYIVQILSSFNLHAAACDAIARKIGAFVAQLAGGNSEVDLHVVAVIQRQSRRNVEESMILDEVPAERSGRGAAPEPEMEELEVGEEEEELGDCSICLDQLQPQFHGGSGKKVIKIRCGHVYHQSCILTWLSNKKSCPLCRAPL